MMHVGVWIFGMTERGGKSKFIHVDNRNEIILSNAI